MARPRLLTIALTLVALGCSGTIANEFENRPSLPPCGDMNYTKLGRPATMLPEHTAAIGCLLVAADNSGRAELHQTLQGTEGLIDQWLRVDGPDREMFMLAPRSDGKRRWSRWRCTGFEDIKGFDPDKAGVTVLGCVGMAKGSP